MWQNAMLHLLARYRYRDSMRVWDIRQWWAWRTHRRSDRVEEVVVLGDITSRSGGLTPLVALLLLGFANVAVLALLAGERLLLLDDGVDDDIEPGGVLLVALAPGLPGMSLRPGPSP